MADSPLPPISHCLLCGYAGGEPVCADGHTMCGRCHKAFWWGQLMSAARREPQCPVVECQAAFASPADSEPKPGEARLALVAEDSEEYGAAVAQFRATLAGATVERVYRVHNRTLEDAFELCRARLGRETKDTAEKAMFHGTDRAAAGSIVRSGFDIRYSGTHGEALGSGIYFAERAAYSHTFAVKDYGNSLCMIVARVLPGRTPESGKSRAASRRARREVGPGSYDSAASGDILVVRREQQALPVYVIYYDVA